MSSLSFEYRNREFVNVLLVSPLIDDHLSLTNLISHSKWGLHHALGCRDAVAILKERPIPVVICGCELSDGTWKDLWREFGGLPSPPKLIVSSRVANERLWGEVIDLGAYDLLTIPFERSEFFRCGFLAWHSWHNQYARQSKPPVVEHALSVTRQGAAAG